jgi:hypothetical protein
VRSTSAQPPAPARGSEVASIIIGSAGLFSPDARALYPHAAGALNYRRQLQAPPARSASSSSASAASSSLASWMVRDISKSACSAAAETDLHGLVARLTGTARGGGERRERAAATRVARRSGGCGKSTRGSQAPPISGTDSEAASRARRRLLLEACRARLEQRVDHLGLRLGSVGAQRHEADLLGKPVDVHVLLDLRVVRGGASLPCEGQAAPCRA